MAKNILVITGSPRKAGNSDLLADAFISGALSKGHQVTKFAAAAKTIGCCRACDTCWSKGHACSFNDGFTELEPLLEQADVLVFASPLYWFAMSAQIKAAMDRMYAYDMENRKLSLKIKEAILLVCGAGESMAIFDGVIASHKCALEYLKWRNAGILAVPGVHAKGDILKTDALQKAEQLGKAL
jgi:multimeric flavodoxin WrbA